MLHSSIGAVRARGDRAERRAGDDAPHNESFLRPGPYTGCV
jgi:hypothetical protein